MSTETLNWTIPPTRTDGTVLNPSDVASVLIFDGTTQIGTAPGGSLTGTFTTPPLTEGTHSFTAEVVDTLGNDSAASNVVTQAVAVAPPSAPALTGTFNP
jgi:hypothetical protein